MANYIAHWHNKRGLRSPPMQKYMHKPQHGERRFFGFCFVFGFFSSDALTNAFNRRIFLFFLGGWARCSALSDRGRAALRCRIAGHPHSPVAVNAYIWPMSIRERGVGTGTSESFLDHFSHFFFFFSSSTSPHTRRVMSTCPTLRPLLIGS